MSRQYFVPGWGYLNASGVKRQYFMPGWGFMNENADFYETITDTAAATDSLAANVGVNVPISDSATATDSATVMRAVNVSYTDTATATDDFVTKIYNRSYFIPGWGYITETGMRQYFMPGWGYISEHSPYKTEEGGRVSVNAPINDTATATDSATITATVNVSVFDNATATDAPSGSGTNSSVFATGLFGSFMFADGGSSNTATPLVQVAFNLPMPAETVTATDSATGIRGVNVSYTDTAAATDSVNVNTAFSETIVDTAKAEDAIALHGPAPTRIFTTCDCDEKFVVPPG